MFKQILDKIDSFMMNNYLSTISSCYSIYWSHLSPFELKKSPHHPIQKAENL